MSAERPARERPRQPVLTFRLGEEAYALPRDRIAGVGALDRLHPVPGAPREVLGLWQREGRVYTVIDLVGMLGGDVPDGRSWAVRLLRPFPFLALRVPPGLRSEELPLVPPGDGWLTPVLHDDRRTRRVELRALVARAGSG